RNLLDTLAPVEGRIAPVVHAIVNHRVIEIRDLPPTSEEAPGEPVTGEGKVKRKDAEITIALSVCHRTRRAHQVVFDRPADKNITCHDAIAVVGAAYHRALPAVRRQV